MKKNFSSRITALLLTLTLILSFSACGKEEDSQKPVDATKTPEVTQTATPEPATPPAPEEAKEVHRFDYLNDTGTMNAALVLMSDDTVYGEYCMGTHKLGTWSGTWKKDGENYIINLDANEHNEAATLISDKGVVEWQFKVKGGDEILERTTVLKSADASAGTSAEGEFIYEGEYYVVSVNMDGEEMIFESFIVESDGKLTGAVDASGLTSFEGKVNPDGTFTAELLRLGGTMTGTIDENLHVEGKSETRGRTATFSGEPM